MNRSILFPALWLIATTTIAQDPKQPATKGPRITFEKMVHYYGTIPYGSNGECTFTYTNTGDEHLIITDCKSSCGCVVPNCSREPLPPGKSAVVKVKYDTRRPGPFSKTVTVNSNAVDQPVLILQIKGVVLPDTAAQAPPMLVKP